MFADINCLKHSLSIFYKAYKSSLANVEINFQSRNISLKGSKELKIPVFSKLTHFD